MAEKNKLTPVMQQYVDLKAENPNALLMFRLGDFYESFFDDAKIISEKLSLVLTARGTDADGVAIPMCGIPWHASDNYFGRLVRLGYSVALVEQMENPAQAKERGHKFIERKIVRVLTPGTLTDENLLNPKKSNFLTAISCSSNGGFDIAGCDISTGEFFIGHSDNIIDDLIRINPAEIIYPAIDAENKIMLRIRDGFKTTPVFEKIYRRTDMGAIIENVFGNAIKSDVVSSNSAIYILAGYLFNTQRGVSITFKAPYELSTGRQLLIDSATWKSLEIDDTINDGGRCLVDVLDNTKTAAGGRKLRSYLRRLSCDVVEISERQKHIEHFINNFDVCSEIDSLLSNIPDVGRSLSRLLSGRGMPRDLSNVCNFMVGLSYAKMMSVKLDDGLAKRFSDIDIHSELTADLRSALSDEMPSFFRDGGVIRNGYDLALDNMRGLSHGAKETIAKLQAEYIAKTGVNLLKIKYNNMLGYFIEIPSSKADILLDKKSGFIHRQTLAGNMRFTTEKLIDLDNDVRSAAEKSSAIEEGIINNFIEKIRVVSDNLLQTADLLADLDVWYSLAICAKKWNWVCPIVTTDTDFDIRGGRHPVIESALREHGDVFIKNDCDLTVAPVALLTGPNMAGKSTYLRQNAMLIVLSHLGSFVPADYAKIGICDQLFSRVGASDNLAAGQSTFMVEMSETANILNRATKNSFIIFDEIGRGTATYDGMAIAQSVLEYLNKLKSRCLFATHYHELTALVSDKKLDNTSCLTIDVCEHNNEIIFMHRIISGIANRSYGIHVAKMAGMPNEVVLRAEQILTCLESKNDVCPVTEPKKDCETIKRGQLSLFD